MRALVGICLLAAGALVPGEAAAQETEALRKELEQMRRQFETMKDSYEKAINQLSERLKTLESRPAAPAVAPAAAAPGTAVPAVASRDQMLSQAQPGITINPTELARPREPFSLYERRGAGQLLFDMGVTGDFIANVTQRNVDKANAGTFSGRENRFFPREIEISLFGQIDPYARAEVRFEAGEEDAGEIAVHLAEANLTLMTLPFNTQLKMGQLRNRFGLLNPIHEHDRPFIDQPNVLTRFLGDEGLVERGAELTWVAPLPFFLEALVGVFNGDNETAFGHGKLTQPLVTGRLRTFFELGDSSAIQLGASVANGDTPERHRNTLLGFDAKYKYKPEGWQHPLLTLLGEMIYQNRRINVLGEDTDGDGVPDTPNEKRTRNRWGWYLGGEVQPVRTGSWSRWAAGFRYDWTEFPIQRGHEWAAGPYLTFMPSEFLRFRLGYKHTERDKRDGFTDNESSARKVDEILFQATFILGAHPAHPF
ncbi:MAG TPA: hypothetical protein VFS98_21930 [Methylomirabilota bacterium]|nr:hypothetical protein [Methylomirabilota bacterium]